MNETHASSPKADLFSAAQAVAAGSDFAELKVAAGTLYWNEFRPQDGACRLWRWHDDAAERLTPDGFSARSRVYEYGGGSFCVADDALVFVNETDQQLYRQPLDGSAPTPLTQGERRYGGLEYAAGQVLAVEEDGDRHRLVGIDLASGARHVLAEGADFYASPVRSPDGTRLAWIEWDRPEQPWTLTRLMCSDGGQAPRCVAQGASQQQPRFDANNRLFCLGDQGGFWQPWGETGATWAPLPAAAADHAGAPWQLGACTWLPLDSGYLATWFEDGFARLGSVAPDGSVHTWADDFSRFRALAADGQMLYALAASPSQPGAVLAIDRSSGQVRVLAGGQSPLPVDQLSLPQTLRYATGDGGEAHGFFYPTRQGDGVPPLLVFIHGGPTSACYPVFDPRIQYWCQRGFAVADLNYRGSSSHGRAYRQALHLQWGVADVDDACAVVAHLAERGLIDADRAFIRGGSAGGYTTLCALAFRKVFRGGASLYGVSDPIALARATHKFEGDYLDWLIGDPVADLERYQARTPLLHADSIEVPVIFFQGELDAVVVPEQTRSMLQALEANGVTAEGHFYPTERHGFRQAANLAHALEQEWRFYQRVLEE